MDLGVMSLDALVSSDPDQKSKWYNGSGLLKQERSGTCTEDELLRTFKLAKTDQQLRNSCTSSSSTSSLLRSNVTTLFSDAQHQQQMLSFSTPNPKSESFLLDKNAPTLSYAYHHPNHNHHHNPLSTYNRNTGYGSGSLHGGFNGVRGPFTPSQWMELEHQALIYKYITANVAVPHHLLIPIRKALDSAGLSTFSSALLRPNAYAMGWGGFHLGYSNNTDPEPGRCRRTDGKKWRCSRDAVVDQKYCERHMNRGRHRSRKPVEGQSGQALTTGGTTNTATTNVTSTITTPSGSSKQINVAASPSSLVVPGGNNATNTLSFAHQEQSKNMNSLIGQDNASSAANTINRMFMNSKENNNNSERIQDGSALPMLPPTLELKPKDNNSFMIQKQHIPYDESSRNNEFGFVTSDSLLNPSQKATTLLGTRTFGSSSQNPSNRDTDSQHSLRHFIDDFPKTHSDHHNPHNRSGGFSWPELDMQSDRTQLSISTPMTASDFMSFPSSATNEKLTLSPLRLSREIDPIQMGLGVGNSTLNNNESSNPSTNNPTARQANWIPITWESSMGGPLGEVLHLSTIACNASDDHYGGNNLNNTNSSALNLMTDGWDNHNSPPMGSSPTGVLQKTAFGSLSNSSAGSSPRAENNKTTQEGASLCNDHLGSTLGNNNTSFTP